VLVAGSTWPADDELIIQASGKLPDNLKFIIVPHDIHGDYIDKLCRDLGPRSCKFSCLNNVDLDALKFLVIDAVGFLSSVYKIATLTYVGGGFGKGIHNILEPACYGKPVIFGPRFHKFREAVELVDMEGAFSVNSSAGFIGIADKLLSDEYFYAIVSQKCISYVNDNSGATAVIIKYLVPYLTKNN